jgi:hypothetical protein
VIKDIRTVIEKSMGFHGPSTFRRKELRNKKLYGHTRTRLPDFSHHTPEMAGPTIREIISRDRCHHDMVKTQLSDGG